MGLIVGVDPGRNIGLAAIDTNGSILRLEVFSVTKTIDVTDTRFYKKSATALRSFCAELPHTDNIKIIIEWPVIYNHAGRKGDLNDLLPLAAAAGAFCSTPSAETELVTPQQWKGQTPKHINHNRIKRCHLNIDEYTAHIPKSKREHALDALGIATWSYNNAKI